MKIIWSPLAIDDVSDATGYIAGNNPQAALKWANSIFEAVERLKKHPKSGRHPPELNRHDIREVIKGNYRIFYKIDGQTINILLVRRGSQLISENEFIEV